MSAVLNVDDSEWFRYFNSYSGTIVIFYFRLRKSYRQYNSISDEDAYHRQSHQEQHNRRARESPASIVDVSGQLIRLCGNALCSTINSAGNSMADFIRGLTKNQNEKEKDLGLTLVILITIIASLMMLVFNGDRSIHHHHWDYFNPPDNSGQFWNPQSYCVVHSVYCYSFKSLISREKKKFKYFFDI